jgi:hypothetical protein
MAKTKPLIDPNLFAKTGTPQPAPQPGGPTDDTRKRRKRDAGDPVKSYGIGLRESEWVKFTAIAGELGTNYHDLGVYVLTDFMARWQRGERPPTETKQVLKRA